MEKSGTFDTGRVAGSAHQRTQQLQITVVVVQRQPLR
jgi:hypothetical protein